MEISCGYVDSYLGAFLPEEDKEEVRSVANAFKFFGDRTITCKSQKKLKNIDHIKATQKGNIFSIITGIALIGIGTVVGLASPGAGVVIVGIGTSLVSNGIGNELNQACEPNKPKLDNLPSMPESSKIKDLAGVPL